jgi:hypothetical protein
MPEPPICGRGLIAARRVSGELNWLIWAHSHGIFLDAASSGP